MNPVDKWHQLRYREIATGGYPSICIMGRDDYAAFCGAVAAINGLESFGHARDVEYHGVRLFRSMANLRGTMFA